MPSTPDSIKEAVLTRALLELAVPLGLSDFDLGVILGTSEVNIKALRHGEMLDSHTTPYLRAIELVLLYENLVGLVGTEHRFIQGWMTSKNREWDMEPLERIKQKGGLPEVLTYLQSALNHT